MEIRGPVLRLAQSAALVQSTAALIKKGSSSCVLLIHIQLARAKTTSRPGRAVRPRVGPHDRHHLVSTSEDHVRYQVFPASTFARAKTRKGSRVKYTMC